jgi:Amt family ammonium transporter
MHPLSTAVVLALGTSASAAQNTTDSGALSAPTIDTGDTAWMLAATALVMLMTPGLGFFYGGLVRAKHSVNTLLMSLVALGIITVLWVVFGYTFSFAGGNVGFGNFDWIGLRGVGLAPNTDYAPTIPHLLFMTYQMMFAIITPAIISGAVVERMSFRSYVIFLVLWSMIVYNALAHWVWSGWTEVKPDGTTEFKMGFLRALGALDFAGGTVVHMSSGYSAFVACLIVGRRKDAPQTITPHNVPLVLLGTAMLWFGWFGFNAGSALGANGLAALAFTNTHIATGTAFVLWVILDSVVKKQITGIGGACGAVVGLVAITPAAGYVHPASSIAFGAITVLVCYFAIELKAKYLPHVLPQADDSLDVFCCHGLGGTMGCILTGFFASTEVNPLGGDGVFFGGGMLLGYQFAAIAVTLGYSAVGTVLLLYTMKLCRLGLTVDDENLHGLDIVLHGVKAYVHDDSSASRAQSTESKDGDL